MATIANLKTAFTADTSGLKKGSNEAKTAIKDFEKVGNESLSAMAEQLGLNTAQIEKLSNAGKGAAMQLTKLFSGASQQASGLASTIGAVSGGLAALGVAAIVTTWKELNAQADHFYTSLEGAPVKAGFDAWKSTLKDIVTEMGNANKTAEMLQGNTKNWTQLGQTVRAIFKGLVGQTDTGDWGLDGIMDNVIALSSATKKAEEAQTIAQRISELAQQTALSQRKIRDYDADIAENKRKAKDETYSIAERQNAVAEASRLINERASFLVPILQEQADLQNELNSFTYTSLEDQMKVENLLGNISDLRRSAATQSMELLEVQRKIANEAKKEAEARQAAYQAMMQMNQYKEMISGLGDIANITNSFASTIPKQVELEASWSEKSLRQLEESLRNTIGNLETYVKVKAEFENSQAKLKKVADGWQQVLTSAATEALVGVGDAIGAAISGSEDPSKVLLSTLASIMRQLGTYAIACGVGVDAIRESLKSLHGAVAIAAGVALVALSSAITGAVSNLGASAGTSGISSGGTYKITGSSVASTKSSADNNITVTGTLKASGDQLIAVIGNTNKRNGYIR